MKSSPSSPTQGLWTVEADIIAHCLPATPASARAAARRGQEDQSEDGGMQSRWGECLGYRGISAPKLDLRDGDSARDALGGSRPMYASCSPIHRSGGCLTNRLTNHLQKRAV